MLLSVTGELLVNAIALPGERRAEVLRLAFSTLGELALCAGGEVVSACFEVWQEVGDVLCRRGRELLRNRGRRLAGGPDRLSVSSRSVIVVEVASLA